MIREPLTGEALASNKLSFSELKQASDIPRQKEGSQLKDTNG
jgi:hypothetical protein